MNFAEMILTAEDLKRQPVATPEWKGADGQLFVQELDAEQRVDWLLWHEDADGNLAKLRNIWARVVVRALVTATGERVFSDEQADGLGKKNADAVRRIYDLCMELSGLSKKAAEEQSKNSEAPTSEPPSS